MVKQLGAEIGISTVVVKLMSAGVVYMTSDHQTISTTQNAHCNVTKHDIPHVTKSDRELQTFRDNSADK